MDEKYLEHLLDRIKSIDKVVSGMNGMLCRYMATADERKEQLIKLEDKVADMDERLIRIESKSNNIEGSWKTISVISIVVFNVVTTIISLYAMYFRGV